MKVLLVCSGGMSSAIVVKAVQAEAVKKNVPITIKSIGAGELAEELGNGWDTVLVAPQVRHRLDAFRAEAAGYDIPVEVIPPQGYSPLGGSIVLTLLQELGK